MMFLPTVVGAQRATPNPPQPLWARVPTPCDVRSDHALKVRFSATVGQEPEIELTLV